MEMPAMFVTDSMNPSIGANLFSTELEVKLLYDNSTIPTRKRETDAGYDLYSVNDASIDPGTRAKVSVGIAVAAPPGYYYTIEGRSGMGMKGVFPFRAIIDATYTGELFVLLFNADSECYRVNVGDRVAQLVLHRIHHAEFKQVEQWSSSYDQRGEAGWGSSGR